MHRRLTCQLSISHFNFDESGFGKSSFDESGFGELGPDPFEVGSTKFRHFELDATTFSLKSFTKLRRRDDDDDVILLHRLTFNFQIHQLFVLPTVKAYLTV